MYSDRTHDGLRPNQQTCQNRQDHRRVPHRNGRDQAKRGRRYQHRTRDQDQKYHGGYFREVSVQSVQQRDRGQGPVPRPERRRNDQRKQAVRKTHTRNCLRRLRAEVAGVPHQEADRELGADGLRHSAVLHKPVGGGIHDGIFARVLPSDPGEESAALRVPRGQPRMVHRHDCGPTAGRARREQAPARREQDVRKAGRARTHAGDRGGLVQGRLQVRDRDRADQQAREG